MLYDDLPKKKGGLSIAMLKNQRVTTTTLWLFNIAMENGPFTDDFPSYKPPFIMDFP